jgi:hypothetical protein
VETYLLHKWREPKETYKVRQTLQVLSADHVDSSYNEHPPATSIDRGISDSVSWGRFREVQMLSPR